MEEGGEGRGWKLEMEEGEEEWKGTFFSLRSFINFFFLSFFLPFCIFSFKYIFISLSLDPYSFISFTF